MHPNMEQVKDLVVVVQDPSKTVTLSLVPRHHHRCSPVICCQDLKLVVVHYGKTTMDVICRAVQAAVMTVLLKEKISPQHLVVTRQTTERIKNGPYCKFERTYIYHGRTFANQSFQLETQTTLRHHLLEFGEVLLEL